jgi:hypothetical protein
MGDKDAVTGCHPGLRSGFFRYCPPSRGGFEFFKPAAKKAFTFVGAYFFEKEFWMNQLESQKPRRVRAKPRLVEVVRVDRLTPHMARIVFAGARS